jgi:hypothetical protein
VILVKVVIKKKSYFPSFGLFAAEKKGGKPIYLIFNNNKSPLRVNSNYTIDYFNFMVLQKLQFKFSYLTIASISYGLPSLSQYLHNNYTIILLYYYTI